MANSVVVTLQTSIGKKDMELPANIPLLRLIPFLVDALKLQPTDIHKQIIRYELFHIQGSQQEKISPEDSLADAHVAMGDFIALINPLAEKTAPGVPRSGSAYTNARLRCPSGRVIALDNLGNTELSVGRYNYRTGEKPDVDLSDERHSDTISRTHARLRKQGNDWVLEALSQNSLTEVNGGQIQQLYSLKPGDLISLGAVKLAFEADSN